MEKMGIYSEGSNLAVELFICFELKKFDLVHNEISLLLLNSGY